jgi:uncharacterized protein (DUF2267 family)
MSMTGLEAFDTTIQKSETWLKAIAEALGMQSRQRAYQVLRATLHALRDRLTVEESANLSAQLPLLIRGIYFEGWRPATVPQKYRTKEQFLTKIAVELDTREMEELERVARAVFSVMRVQITPGEIDDVKSALPAKIEQLWQW